MPISYQRTHNRQSTIGYQSSTEDREVYAYSVSEETEGIQCKREGYLGKVVLPLCGGNVEYSYEL